MSATRLYETSPYDIFINVHNKSHLARRKLKLAQNKSDYEVLEFSGIKLHISITPSDYAQHRDGILDILYKYVSDDRIHSFKYANSKLILDVINSNKLTPLLIKSHERYFNGNQFTIYIPKNYDKKIILQLCAEINTYIKKNNIQPGKISSTESTITDYVNLRQENLDGKYLHPLLATNDQVSRVRQMQEDSEIYRYLDKHIGKHGFKNDLLSIFSFFGDVAIGSAASSALPINYIERYIR